MSSNSLRQELIETATKLIKKYPEIEDYQFKIKPFRKAIAKCNTDLKVIFLNSMALKYDDILSNFEYLILHEIAHAILFVRNPQVDDDNVNHGPHWKKVCEEMGILDHAKFTHDDFYYESMKKRFNYFFHCDCLHSSIYTNIDAIKNPHRFQSESCNCNIIHVYKKHKNQEFKYIGSTKIN